MPPPRLVVLAGTARRKKKNSSEFRWNHEQQWITQLQKERCRVFMVVDLKGHHRSFPYAHRRDVRILQLLFNTILAPKPQGFMKSPFTLATYEHVPWTRLPAGSRWDSEEHTFRSHKYEWKTAYPYCFLFSIPLLLRHLSSMVGKDKVSCRMEFKVTEIGQFEASLTAAT